MDEQSIFEGYIIKKRKLSSKKRLLVLTNKPRLFYVDMAKKEIKGSIPLTKDTKVVVLKGKKWEVNTQDRRYDLTCEDGSPESPRVHKRQLKARANTDLVKCLVVTGFNPSHLKSDDNNIREVTNFLPHVRCLRRLGSACLDFCNVAASRIDCYWEKGPHIWDVAAGWLIATKSGAIVTHYDGSPFTRESLLKPMIDLIVATQYNLYSKIYFYFCFSLYS